jgi:predicted permease
LSNLKLALRRLAKTPFITTVAVLSLALGIGANSAMFSLFDQMILKKLPVPEPERLVNLAAPGPKPGSQSCNQAGSCEDVFSYAMFRDLEREQRAFSGIAAHNLTFFSLSYRDVPFTGDGVYVSGSYFPVLGVQPALGRLLGPNDDQAPGQHYVVVLSHEVWTSQLGADPGVLNQTLIVNGQPFTIVGVAPEGFGGATLGARPLAYVPISMRGVLSAFTGFDNRRNYWVYLFGRLAPGVSVEQADAEINRLYQGIVNEVEVPLQEGLSEQTMQQFRAKKVLLSDGSRGQSSFQADVGTPLNLLLTVTGVVLLIACANIANLLLARGARRGPEIAIRGALGGSRKRLLGQLLTESWTLAALGALGSLLVARWTLVLIERALPPGDNGLFQSRISFTMIAFSAALAMGTGLLFGLYPALHSTRSDLVTALKNSSGQPAGARSASRFRSSLVTAQIALSMTLLVLAGLFIKSLANVSRIELGVSAEDAFTFRLSPVRSGYDPARSRELFERVEQGLARLPTVVSVTSTRIPILAGSSSGNDVTVEGFEGGPDVDQNARMNEVGAGYFAALGIRVLAGREFTMADDSVAADVAVVNESFARKFNMGGAQAVGKRMRIGRGDGDLDIEIVGLVKDTKYASVKDEVPPQYFRPHRQSPALGTLTFYARTSQDPEAALASVRPLMESIDPSLPIEELKTLEQEIGETLTGDTIVSTLAIAFAGLATLLTAVGLYGVLAYTVAQRTREIGLRMALGAGSARVRAMVVKQVGWMTVIGGVLGIAAAYGLGRAARSLLFGVQSHDPVVIVLVSVVLAAVALSAAYVPALRASRVDPMKALRYE